MNNKGKILFYDWDSLMQRDILNALQGCGYYVVLTHKRMKNYYDDSDFAQYLSKLLQTEKPDFCFSFNFFPLLADICKREEVVYVSWIFDSPLLNLYNKSVFYANNRIFHFDRGAAIALNGMGVNIRHLPLASCETKRNIRKFQGKRWEEKELSFVGRIYDKKNYYDQIHYLPERLKGYLEGLMAAQRKVWGYNFLEECLTADVMAEICKYVKMECPDSFFYTPQFVFSNLFLNQKITAMEREEALQVLSGDGPVHLYSDSLPDSLKNNENLRFEGVVDSDNEAPAIFHTSRINLNYTLRSILTGIPLRVFDIAASGGMVLSNYQEEIPECFEPEKEIVLFGSVEEMKEKAAFYRAHPEECAAIAQAGWERVKKEHTLTQRVGVLFA